MGFDVLLPRAADPQGTPCPCVLGVDDGAGSGFPAVIDVLSILDVHRR